MRVAVWSMRTVKTVGLTAVCMGAAVLLLMFPQAAGNGVRRGLAVCGEILIPSLFPFLVLSGFMIRSGVVGGIGRVLSPLMNRVFGLSGSAAVAMAVAMIGGYPAGANAVAQLYEQGEIDRREGQRLLRCCVSAGPAFVIGGIGAGMFGSAQIGVRLLIAQWIAFLAVALLERERQAPRPQATLSTMGIGASVAESVNAAAFTLLSMGGFVLAASAVLSVADAVGLFAGNNGIWRCLAACVTEVSVGCLEAARMGRLAPLWIGVTLGFGGLAVHGQIAARAMKLGLMERGFFRARLWQALLGGGLSWLLCRDLQPVGVQASAVLSAFAPEQTAAGASGLMALMLMCVLCLCSMPSHREAV